jgi:hypothetical protein
MSIVLGNSVIRAAGCVLSAAGWRHCTGGAGRLAGGMLWRVVVAARECHHRGETAPRLTQILRGIDPTAKHGTYGRPFSAPSGAAGSIHAYANSIRSALSTRSGNRSR